jgi:hypothetical protein
MKTWRAARRGLIAVPQLSADNTKLPAQPAPEGRVTAGVRDEVAQLSAGVTERYPSLVATALALATGLDDWRQLTTWPSLARQLLAVMTKLHAVSAGGKGRLAEVARMTRRGPA